MIPVNTPLLSGNEKKYLQECIDTGWISSEGPFVNKFETEFAKAVGRKYATTVTNGSDALLLALQAIGIKKNDEIILPSFTIISCSDAIIRLGAIPVVVDSDPITWNMDISQIEGKINSNTKAIMVVHIYGLPVDMDPVLEIAKKHGLKVIEDAAQMHGQSYKGKPCGSFGDVSTFSFYANKTITTGEGGMVVMNNEEIADKAHYYKNLCFNNEQRFVHEDSGWNMRMTNLQAAVGLAQLEQLETMVNRRRWIGKLYQDLLSDLEEFQFPLQKTDYAENIYWVFGLVSIDKKIDVRKLCRLLAEKKIGTRPFFYPIHKQPVYKKMGLFQNESLPVSENLSTNGFYLPSGLGLTEDDIHTVASSLKEVHQ